LVVAVAALGAVAGFEVAVAAGFVVTTSFVVVATGFVVAVAGFGVAAGLVAVATGFVVTTGLAVGFGAVATVLTVLAAGDLGAAGAGFTVVTFATDCFLMFIFV
jgi:hypothetical protein